MAYWVGRVGEYADGAADGDVGLSIEQVASSFFEQPETQANYPAGITNEAFVDAVYQNAFHRAPDAFGRAYWLSRLDAGEIPRSELIVNILRGAYDDATATPPTRDDTLLSNQRIASEYYTPHAGDAAHFSVTDATCVLKPVTSDVDTITISQGRTDEIISGFGVTPPVFASAAVSDSTLVMTYTVANSLDATHKAATTDFAVFVDGVANAVTAVAVNASANAVILTLTTAVTHGQAVTVGYTDPTACSDLNAIQDAAGNDSFSLTPQSVTNTTPVPGDILAPVFASAVVNGNALVMSYADANPLDAGNPPLPGAFAVVTGGSANAVTAVLVNAVAKTVTLTLAAPVLTGQAVTVAYTDPTASNNLNAIQDAAGNDALSLAPQSVTNTTPVPGDILAPVFGSAVVNGSALVLSYADANPLDAGNPPIPGAFTVVTGGVANAVTAVAVNAVAKTVTLTLASPVLNGQPVTVAYADPTAGNALNAIQDAAGNDSFSLTPQSVTNATGGVFTTGADNIVGTPGSDTFSTTYDAAVTDSFSGSDSIDGSGGADTLHLDHLIDVAITPPDTLWTNLKSIEKMVINTTGNGAQTITTGPNFEAAFATGGIDLTTATSGAGAINVTMSAFTGAATITTTSIAGAQTVITGSGVAAVIATSGAGALTIYGAGLATATATTTGAGAQTIGNGGGGGANLVTVTAASNSGAQVITSTSTNAVTVNATATAAPQTITTGTGNDTVMTTGAAGQSNTITTHAGNDTIVASLGTDLITSGTGADRMTGGGGIDTFAFGADGSVIGISRDVITDFNAAGADILIFGASTTLLAIDATALVAGSGAGSNVQQSAGGLITFHPIDNTLALKIAAVQADTQLDAANSVAMFIDSGNTYVYYAGTAAGNADDQLIELSGISLSTITGGSTTTIA